MIMATTHVDAHGDKMSLEALQSMARQVKERYIPININHDIRYPPVGRIVSAEIIKLSDGEYALLGTAEVFDESDTLESLVGDGRRIKVIDEDIETISVFYDRTFLHEREGEELIRELTKISSEKPVVTFKKALEPISVLVIAAGVFILGSIAEGFFKKLGSDLYDKLRDTLTKYFKKKLPREQIIDFCFSVKYNERIFEVHILVDNPSEKELNELFTFQFCGVDRLLTSLPLNKELDIAKLVLEYKNKKLSILYAVRSDCVPLSFKKLTNKMQLDAALLLNQIRV